MHKEAPFVRLALAVCLGIAPMMAPAAEQSTDLLSVVQTTLDTNPELRAHLDAFHASTEDRREVFGGYLPSIDLSASVGQANRQFDNRSDYSRNYAEISLTQMLFDGFRVRNALAKADHTSRVRYYELLDEAETKALEASEAYLSVQRHRELVKLAQDNLANHQRVYEHVGQRAERGVSNRADLQQIEGRLSLARSNLMTEVANLQSVTARYQRLVGQLPAEQLQPYEVPAARIPAELGQVLRNVYANNPALYAAFENTEVAQAALRETKANRYPTLELGMRHGTYKNNNSFDNRTDPSSYGDESIIELRARYNLYRGGSDRAAERAAWQRISQAESLRDKTCVDLRQTATIAFGDVLNLQGRLASLERHRTASAAVLVAYREQFDIGRRSLLDVLDSENEAFQAERAYTNGRYDLQIARLYTLHSMGELMNTLSLSSDAIPPLEDLRATPAHDAASRYCEVVAGGVLDIDQYLQPQRAQQVVNLSGDVLFDVGSAAIRPGTEARLQNLLQRVQEQGELRSITIVGHTDSTGSASLNRELSLARAVSVREFLIQQGVERTMITVAGAGADRPVASNNTAEGRAENRRVELHINRAE
ncbi:outer membrane protein, adhesin transport system [Halopseudomonas formosensis]|uniref:Outer membrane protein, adhesin transport system n=2 Tax=Halopseudomonas formosensis TaxID=1002526 RepID=A0A1I6BVV7_9GAMM|nr:outer membrane protein, adhesin transport system [Halopseudomonas formosensis]